MTTNVEQLEFDSLLTKADALELALWRSRGDADDREKSELELEVERLRHSLLENTAELYDWVERLKLMAKSTIVHIEPSEVADLVKCIEGARL